MALQPRFGSLTGVVGVAGRVALICIAVGSLACRPAEPPPSEAAAGEVATSRIEGVDVSGEAADGTIWQLHAAEGSGREGEVTGTLRAVRATLRKGGHDLVVESEQARVDTGTVLHLSGGVRITWDGYSVQVEQAVYEQDSGLITSDGPMVFTGPGLHLTGVGVEVAVDSRVIRIPRDVRAEIGKGWH